MTAADAREWTRGSRPSSGTRRLDIQGLRAIAVLMVVAFHIGVPIPGGFVGVDVFFVISGFVIAAMLQREWRSTGRVRFGRFYLRRFKRLTPALALTLSATMLLSLVFLSPLGTQQDTSRTAIGAVFLGANLVIAKITGGYFDLEAETNALLNTWSLSVEEQFYLAFPLLLVLGWTIARRRGFGWAPLAVVGGVAAISFGLAVLGASGYVLPRETWLLEFYSPLTRAWEFAVGALVALLGGRAVVTSRRLADGLGLMGTGLLVVSLVAITGEARFPGAITLIPVVGSLALLLAGQVQESTTHKVLSAEPLVRIGDWSYSIYLWHWPLIVFATLTWPGVWWVAPAAAAVSFIPAVASYTWVETPLRSYSPPSRASLAAFAVTTVSIPLVLSVGLWQASEHGFWNPKVQTFQAAIFAQPETCSRTLTQETVEECTRNTEAPGPPVYLLGDSNAGQYAEGLVAAGIEVGRPVVLSTTNACPFLDIRFQRLDHPDSRNDSCRTHVQQNLAYLESADPATIIISNIDTYWTDSRYAVGSTTEPGAAATTDPAAKLEVLRAGLASTVERLQSAGHEVMLFQTIPRWSEEDTWRTASCGVLDLRSGGCDQSMPTSRALERQGEARQVIDEAGEATGATVFDPWTVLCQDGHCETQGADFPRYYRDGVHISVPEGQAFAPLLARMLGTSVDDRL